MHRPDTVLLCASLLIGVAAAGLAEAPRAGSLAPAAVVVEPGLDVPSSLAWLGPWTEPVGAITDIGTLLDTCPANDPLYTQLRDDFEIRRNGNPVAGVACSEPVSAMAPAAYSDELIVLQGLRVAYYMDVGSSGHLPWTAGTLYQWMRSKIDGIDIRDGVAGGSCCETLDGKTFFVSGAQNDFNRGFDRTWMGISGNIAFYAHEVRHVDGFPHVSCCGIPGGCDQEYDPANPSAYGVQFYLNRLWLLGDINVGFACLPAAEFQETVSWHAGSLDVFRDRFCTKPPPVALPAQPGGPCPATAGCQPGPDTLCLNGGRFKVEATWTTSAGTDGVGHAVPLTADTGYLWFFNAANVEVVIKVLDGCGLNNRYWVFAAGLTNVRVELTVTDTQSGASKVYVNPANTKFVAIQDTGAFATCP